MTISENATLAELVKENYRVASVLERYRMDYCCRGKRTLQTVCNEQGLDFEKISVELQALLQQSPVEEQEPWLNMEGLQMTALVDHIESQHHQYVKNEIPVINALLERVAGKHGTKHPELVQIREKFMSLADDLLFHLRKEEKILFPAIRQFEAGIAEAQHPSALLTPIAVMEAEHESAGDEMEAIRQLSNEYMPPEDACTSYRIVFQCLRDFENDLHRHVHLENNVLFPAIAGLAG